MAAFLTLRTGLMPPPSHHDTSGNPGKTSVVTGPSPAINPVTLEEFRAKVEAGKPDFHQRRAALFIETSTPNKDLARADFWVYQERALQSFEAGYPVHAFFHSACGFVRAIQGDIFANWESFIPRIPHGMTPETVVAVYQENCAVVIEATGGNRHVLSDDPVITPTLQAADTDNIRLIYGPYREFIKAPTERHFHVLKYAASTLNHGATNLLLDPLFSLYDSPLSTALNGQIGQIKPCLPHLGKQWNDRNKEAWDRLVANVGRSDFNAALGAIDMFIGRAKTASAGQLQSRLEELATLLKPHAVAKRALRSR